MLLFLSRILIVLNVFVYASAAYLYFYDAGYTDIKPLYLYLTTISSTLVLVFLSPNSVFREIPRPFVAWLWIYLCYLIINFLYSSQSAVALDLLIASLESAALLSAFLVLFVFHKESGIRTAQLAMLLVALFGVLMNVVDFLGLTSLPLSRIDGRAAGLYVNANSSGKTLVILMAGSVPLLAKKLRFLYCVLVGCGILLTFSRSAWLLWALFVVGLASIEYIGFQRKKYNVMLIGCFGGIALYVLFSGGLVEIFTSLDLSDKLTTNTLTRMGGGEESALTDSSAADRYHLVSGAWQKFQQHPWFGFGLGYTREWDLGYDAHNTYLSMAVQGGLFGLGMLISLFAILWHISDSYGRVLVAVFAVQTFFSHMVFLSPRGMIFLALIAAMGKSQRGAVPSAAPGQATPAITTRQI